MLRSGVLEKVDGRQLVISGEAYFLRKSVDPTTLTDFVSKEVTVDFEEDKGFKMVSSVKPEIPTTEVEKTPAQPQQAPSATMAAADAGVRGAEFVAKAQPRSQKDMDIMTQWSLGQATSPTWANCNDALVLSTEQMKLRIRDLSAWYRNEVLGR